jgi:DtxR family Mn-dependent transcriptional regulator
MVTLNNIVLDEKTGLPAIKPSETIEEYCEAIFNLSADEEGPVKAVHLAARMGVAPATVFATIQRMQKSGLVRVDQHNHQLKLSPAGEQIALRLTRRHSLLERFLFDDLGLPWDEVHEEACELEHVLSPAVEEALNGYLGFPSTCPHGNLIPGNSPQEADETRPLDQEQPGRQVKIVRVSEEGEHEHGLLQYLYRLGLLPGTALHIKGKSPFDETIQVVNSLGQELTIGRKTAHAIRVIEEPGAADPTL